MIDTAIDGWQAQFSENLLAQAAREIDHRRPRITGRLVIAWGLSAIVLVSPFIVMVLGSGLILTTFPRILPGMVGLILIGFGFTLLPQRHRNTRLTYRRSDLPYLFDLLDQVAARLDTRPPDGVHLNSEFNAYMTQFSTPFSRPQEWVVGIGFPLWAASSPAERIAHLAHELGHKVNDDPMRQGVFFHAKTVLENWYDAFDPDAHHEVDGRFV